MHTTWASKQKKAYMYPHQCTSYLLHRINVYTCHVAERHFKRRSDWATQLRRGEGPSTLIEAWGYTSPCAVVLNNNMGGRAMNTGRIGIGQPAQGGGATTRWLEQRQPGARPTGRRRRGRGGSCQTKPNKLKIWKKKIDRIQIIKNQITPTMQAKFQNKNKT